MLQIGTIIQWGNDPTELYEIIEGNRLYSPKYEDTYTGYSFREIERFIKEGKWKIYNYSPEIY